MKLITLTLILGRIHYCYYYEPSVGQYRIKVNILKNSDDV